MGEEEEAIARVRPNRLPRRPHTSCIFFPPFLSTTEDPWRLPGLAQPLRQRGSHGGRRIHPAQQGGLCREQGVPGAEGLVQVL